MATAPGGLQTTKSRTQRISTFIKSFDVQHGQPLRVLQPRDTIVPICMVSSLFFSWGLLYGLLDIMNYHVKVAMGIKREQSALLAAGYYLAYLPGTVLLGSPLVRKFGYRVAMVTGLLIMTLGALFMSIGASRQDLTGMILAHVVIGLAVSTLERAANPYAVNCGPRTQATLRILFAQAWAGIGTVVAPFLANAFVFDASISNMSPIRNPFDGNRCVVGRGHASGDLKSVVSFYRALAGCIFGLTLVLAVAFFRTKWVPEVSQPQSPKTTCGWKLWKHPLLSLSYSRLWWGVFANFFNLGCQVTFAQFFIEHMKVNACANDKQAALYMSFAQMAFVAGRFFAALLVAMPKVFKPRFVLAFFIAGALAFCAAGTVTTSTAALACAIIVMFWEAPSFPMIFESATADFAEWTSTCETLMILSISGGALQPALMGKLVESVRISKAWWFTTACFGLVLTYGIASNLIPSFKQALDIAEVDGKMDEFKDEKAARCEKVETTSRPLLSDQQAQQGYFGGVLTSPVPAHMV